MYYLDLNLKEKIDIIIENHSTYYIECCLKVTEYSQWRKKEFGPFKTIVDANVFFNALSVGLYSVDTLRFFRKINKQFFITRM